MTSKFLVKLVDFWNLLLVMTVYQPIPVWIDDMFPQSIAKGWFFDQSLFSTPKFLKLKRFGKAYLPTHFTGFVCVCVKQGDSIDLESFKWYHW